MSGAALASVRATAPTEDERQPSELAGGDHAVQFYESDDFLGRVVADFVEQGVRAGAPALLVATGPHRLTCTALLRERGIDVEDAVRAGRLVMLDARETLSRFLVDGGIDREAFQRELAVHVRRPGQAAPLYVFGEMVDLLWKDGNLEAAVALESLWNELGRGHRIRLLCGYALDGFHAEVHRHPFERICRTHTHVLPAESCPPDFDIQALRRHVALLQQRARALETEVAHRRTLERDLVRQNDELAQTVRFSEMFVGILGHDLRNPLSAITTAASLLVRRFDSEAVVKPAMRVLSSGQRMARMIDQLLDFTRVRIGTGIALERRPTDLGELCRLCSEEIEAAVDSSEITIHTRGDPVGAWDTDRLSQLVSNLLSNAVAHGDPGEPVTLAVDGRDPQWVVLRVRNAGVVSDDVLPLIFEPFKCGADKKRERSSGLGLGLYIGQQIALGHGGKMEVASSADAGTCFTVRLPRMVATAQAAEPRFPS
jgi:signal transduction histidine kinase